MRRPSPPPAVHQDHLPETWGLGAPHTWRVGYLDDGKYTFVRYAATKETRDHFVDVLRVRKPDCELVIERSSAGGVLRPCDPPLHVVPTKPARASAPLAPVVQPQLG